MRLGSNPEKNNNNIELNSYHRVVVPVYIPNYEGYFKDSFAIFKLNIESLIATVHSKTRITIYNNNCTEEVKIYINELYNAYPQIDQVFHSKENLGKVNAILAAVKGNLEPLITITDSDVLFKHNWQQEVEKTFIDFPNAGMVSPVPGSKALKNFTANNWYFGILGKGSIAFETVQDPIAMQKFDASLGNDFPLYLAEHLSKYLVLTAHGKKAVMGCGHFVATLRREVFDKGSNSPAFVKIVGGVENKFIDIPNENLGFLRLATLGNYAYHMGNIKEEWMSDEFNSLKNKTSNSFITDTALLTSRPFSYWQTLLGKLSRKVFLSKALRNSYFKKIGLSSPAEYPI